MTERLPETTEEQTTTERRQTILVVDDEQDLRSLVVSVLTEYGYKVIAASSAAKAIALLAKMDTPPDLLLTDVVMPGMSGTHAVPDAGKIAGARVLFMSGYDERQVVQRYVVEKGLRADHQTVPAAGTSAPPSRRRWKSAPAALRRYSRASAEKPLKRHPEPERARTARRWS